MSAFNTANILDLIDLVGEEEVEKILSDFSCEVISQILCKHRFWCTIEQNIFKAGAAQAA